MRTTMPNRCVLIAALAAVVVVAAGCQSPASQPKKVSQKQTFDQQAKPKRGITIAITDGSAFPDFLAGVWRQDSEFPREFIISKDGRIPSVVLGLGLVRVNPDSETKVPLIDGTEGFFIPGDWSATYDPASRVLTVNIEISAFRMQNGLDVVEGAIRETFQGPISDDGRRWDVHYVALSEYHAYTKEGEYKVLMDGSEPDEQDLVFLRVYSPYEPEKQQPLKTAPL